MTEGDASTWNDDELVFAEPWQGRAAALARAWVDAAEAGAFRSGLSATLAEDPTARYFESMVGALEAAALGSGRVAADQLDRARLTAATYAVTDPEHGAIEVLSLLVDEGNRVWAVPLFGLVDWRRVHHLEAYWGSAPSSSVAGIRAFDREERPLADVPVERAKLERLLSDVLFPPRL
ncbi:hypothetical protein GCM10022237_10450 [Nocardioides ginsengisoli]|uniref:Uncharacterized protein n=1 Tax=Nocardioides ginsengisoli TaxID=363868 RepID=A0ABW3W7J2_9ACTN